MYRYQIVKEALHTDADGEYTSYGIRMVQCNGTDRTMLYVSDVSADLAFAEKLVRLFAELQPEPEHLQSVIEDLL